MIVGKYNFGRLKDFEQVCLCCVLRNRAKSINMISPVPYTQIMWTKSDDGGLKLTDEGCNFLTFCKKAENQISKDGADIEYSRAFDAVVKESRKCGKEGMIEKFLYYTKMEFDTAKSYGDVVKQDDMWRLSSTAVDFLLIMSSIEVSSDLFGKNKANANNFSAYEKASSANSVEKTL